MDLKLFLLKLKENGQLANINEETDWNLQAGAISTLNQRMSGPAIHFKKIKDYPSEYSLASGLFTGPFNIEERKGKPWSRQAIAQGLDKNIGYEEFINELITRTTQTVLPISVNLGPCKEHIISGKDIDIQSFPVPYIHEGDGGRYGNCSVLVTKDPETRWQYCGWHRWMVAGQDSLAINFNPPIAPWLPANSHHLGKIYQKYQEQKSPMPCAIVIGGSPSILMASAMLNPAGTNIEGIAGGLMKEPLPLVKTEGEGLLVPADAEIIIEGEISPNKTVEQRDYNHIIAGKKLNTMAPLLEIKRITCRKAPIFPFMAEGDRGSDYISLVSSFVSLNLTQFIKRRNVVARWVNCPVEAMMSLCLVCIERIYPGHPAIAARACFASPLSKWFDKVLVLDPDVEPIDWPVIINCLAEKVNPEKNYHYLKGAPSYLASYSNSDEKNNLIAKKLYIDATFPLWWEQSWLAERLSIETCFSQEILQKVLSSWKEYGLPGEPYLKKTRRIKLKKGS